MLRRHGLLHVHAALVLFLLLCAAGCVAGFPLGPDTVPSSARTTPPNRVLLIADGRSGSTSLLGAFSAWQSAAFLFFEPFAGGEADAALAATDALAPRPTYAQLFSCELSPAQWRRIMWREACRATLPNPATAHGSGRSETESEATADDVAGMSKRCLEGVLSDDDIAVLRARCRRASTVVIKTIRLARSPLQTLVFDAAETTEGREAREAETEAEAELGLENEAAGRHPVLSPRPGASSMDRPLMPPTRLGPLQLVRVTRRDGIALAQSWARLGWFKGDAAHIVAALCDALLFVRGVLATRPHLHLTLEDYVQAPLAVWSTLAPACGLPWAPGDQARLNTTISGLFRTHEAWRARHQPEAAARERDADYRAELVRHWRQRCPAVPPHAAGAAGELGVSLGRAAVRRERAADSEHVQFPEEHV